jgi:hypothetical protein
MEKQTPTLQKSPLLQSKILKIAVRDDAHEVGIVVARLIEGKKNEYKVSGQTKIFPSEMEKLCFLAGVKNQGFQNFETVAGKINMEKVILKELARRQEIEEKGKNTSPHISIS